MPTPTQVDELVEVISLYGKAAGRDNYRYPVAVPASESHIIMLDEAYALTNADERPNSKRVPATSPGDILILREQAYLVLLVGYKPITPAELMSLLALDIPGTIQHIINAATRPKG